MISAEDNYLKDGQQALPEAVEVVAWLVLQLAEVELSAEHLRTNRTWQRREIDGRVIGDGNSTCMPRRANITMKRKSRSNSDAIDWIEFNRDATRFDSDLQYLQIVAHG